MTYYTGISSRIRIRLSGVGRDFDRFETSYELFDALQVLKQTDVSTMAHSMNVSIIARLIGVWAGLDTEKLDEISMAGLLHDIGKFKIPDEILLKPGKLTKEEFEVIKKHTVYGYEILNNFKILESTKRAALLHHEKFDGSGYPFGYKSDKIDDISAIITISDVYDAMTSKRCYRDGMCPFDVIADFEYDGISKYHPKYNRDVFGEDCKLIYRKHCAFDKRQKGQNNFCDTEVFKAYSYIA